MKYLHSPFSLAWTELFTQFKGYVGPQTPPPPPPLRFLRATYLIELMKLGTCITQSNANLMLSKNIFLMSVAFADDSRFFCSGSEKNIFNKIEKYF